MAFQLNAKNLLLTYAKCNVSKETLLAHLSSLLPDVSIRVGHELHADGDDHLHVFITSENAIRTRNQRYFDYNGFHPNIVSCRNPKKGYEYAGKDGDYVETGAFEFDDKKTWRDAIGASSAEEALSIIRDNYPRDYIVNNDKITSYVRYAFTPVVPNYQPRDRASFNVARWPELDEFVTQMTNEGMGLRREWGSQARELRLRLRARPYPASEYLLRRYLYHICF